ncbi:MAG: hypothetical protein IT338_07655, partial [Thermomicrobiales bacterium]|nr:hypothetical protein [Thermomicrobiales bacterium]
GSLGLAPLNLNYQLGAAAEYHSADMATNNYFDHYLFDGTDPGTNIRNFGYTALPFGENIAAGMASAEDVLIAWQNSPSHDAAMRNPEFTDIGVGRVYGDASYYGWYWTADFGGGGAPAAVPAQSVDASGAPQNLNAPEQQAGLENYDGNGQVVELPQNTVNADGDRAAASGANPVADGTGDTVIYGDINTGGVQGETVVYEPPSLTVSDAPAPAPVADTAASDGATYVEPTDTAPVDAAPVTTEPAPAAPVYSEPTFTESTTTNISMEDGNGRAIG